MSVTELQQKLIDKISGTTDAGLLKDIYDFIGADEAMSTLYELSDEQLNVVEDSQQQIKQGNHFTNDQVNKETDEWLGK